MAVELRFTKTDNTPWGFRLTGGSDYEVPLTVIKVTEGSIAENAGMQVGDVIVRINDVPTAGLTHTQAHDNILEGGNGFVLAVERGDLSSLPPRLLLVETSVENDFKSQNKIVEQNVECSLESKDLDLNITDEEIVNIIGELPQTEKQVQNTIVKQSEVIQAISIEESEELSQERKWSTFLQKPKNPKPKPVQTEPQGPKAPPYRVIIKKQPKKSLETSEQILNNVISDNKAIIDEPIQSNEEAEPEFEELKPELDENENVTEGDAQVLDEQNGEDLGEQEKIDEDADSSIQVEYSPPDSRRPSESERKVSYSLEEQLAQVQKQLLALSQLPSAIQETLNAVTQQLSQIVAIKEQEEMFEAIVTVKEETTEEVIEGGLTLEAYEENVLSTLAEEESYEIEAEGRNTASMRDDTDDEQALYEMLEKECEKDKALDEALIENEEALREEQERNEKKEKELMEEYRLTQPDQRPSHPLTPLQRPIILPGGRKWSQPDDAVSKIRRPSMTDEKIANTINTYSEVIIGHTMGINFLKYQPPPKNLDHLQRSAVYKLVHDIEPPVRGIIARETKVLAEQDYYSQQEEIKLIPQMER